VRVVGIDPGKTGAMVLMQGGSLTVIDLEVATNEVNGKHVYDYLGGSHAFQAIDAVFMELSHANPKNGSKGNYSTGFANGAITTAVRLAGIPLHRIPASTWKRKMGLWGKDKNASRDLATELFPLNEADFKLVKHHNRAEAALIARYGLLFLIHEANAEEAS